MILDFLIHAGALASAVFAVRAIIRTIREALPLFLELKELINEQ